MFRTKRNFGLLFAILFLCFQTTRGKRLDPGCKTSELDVAFLIDSSEGVSALSLRSYKNFVKRIINSYDVSAATIRPSVSLYGSTVIELNSLADVSGDFFDSLVTSEDTGIDDVPISATLKKNDITKLVSSARPVGGRRMVGNAVSYVCDVTFGMNQQSEGVIDSRRPVPKVIVVISGGSSDDEIPTDLSCFNQNHQGKHYDVTILGVSVGSAAETSLKSDYVSEVLRVDSTERLLVLDDKIGKGICDAALHDCPKAHHDLVFMIDGSDSVSSSDFEETKKWAKEISRLFEIGADKTRVGVVQNARLATSELELSDYTNPNDVALAISNIAQVGGTSNSANALRYAVQHSFTELFGARDDMPQLLLYLTAGGKSEKEDFEAVVEELHFSGVIVNIVGVGSSLNKTELRLIASRPASQHIITISRFDELLGTRSKLVARMCEELHPSQPSSVIDIQFLLHSSVPPPVEDESDLVTSTVEEAFKRALLKTWLKQLVDNFFVGKHYARVAMSTYGDNPTFEFGFNDYLSKNSLFEKINSLETLVREGDGRLGFAMNFTLQNLTNQARPDAKQVLVLVTDTPSSDSLKGVSELYRSRDVPVFVVGLGNQVNRAELEGVAADSDYFIEVPEGVVELRTIKSQLASLISDSIETECDDIELDIQYLVDGSTSINPTNFAKVKEWIKSLTSTFDIGIYTNRVGLNQYSDKPKIEFRLNRYDTKSEVLGAIENVEYMTGFTEIGKAMNFTRENSLIEAAGARPLVKKMLIVMTDGNSQDSIEEASNIIHDMKLVRTFAVGVGEASIPQLRTIASDPDSRYMYKVEDFDAINTIRKSLIKKICEDGQKDKKITCPGTEMDAVILLDAFIGAREPAFVATKKLLTKLVESFNVGEFGALFSCMQYAGNTRVEFRLNEHMTSQAVSNAINAVQPVDVSGRPPSNLGSALMDVRQHLMEDSGFGSRKNVPKAIFIVTASSSNDDVEEASQQLENDGIHVFAITGGTRTNTKQIKQIVTSPPPRHFFPVNRFHQISKLERSLTRSICAAMETDCRDRAADIMLLLECSSSTSDENLDFMKKLLIDIISQFDIGNSAVQVGLYGHWDLNSFSNTQALLEAINSVQECPDDRFISQSLKFLYEEAFLESRGGRNNTLNLAVLITDKMITDGATAQFEAAKVHFAGINIITVGVGSSTSTTLPKLASSPVPLHSFQVAEYTELPEHASRVVRTICRDARCPVIEKNGETMRGVNLLEKFGMLDGNVKGVKEERGIRRGDVAYRCNGRRAELRTPKREVVPLRCLYYFNIITVVSMRKNTYKDSNWDVINITDDQGETEVSISCRGKQRHFVIIRKGLDDLTIQNNVTDTFFNRNWHQLEVQFGRNDVIMYIDCKKVGSYPVGFPLRRVINETGYVNTGTFSEDGRSPIFTVQDMYMRCHDGDLRDENRDAPCCALKNHKNKRCKREAPVRPTTRPETTTTTATDPITTPLPTTTAQPPTTTPSTTPTPTTTTEFFLPAGKPEYDFAFNDSCVCQGDPGPAGPPGPPGVNGEPGIPGDRGEKGDSGSMGIPGFPGVKGVKGSIGLTGPPGPPGPPGPSGPSDIELPDGQLTQVKGQKGEKGDVGRNGVNGAQKGWNRGVPEQRVRQITREIVTEMMATEVPRMIVQFLENQYRVPAGERGRPGPPGPRGFTGDAGPSGLSGPPGERGPAGIQGVPGMMGMPGNDGRDGEKGSEGIGLIGPVGPPGPRGFPGESVQGPPGQRGPPGPQGRRGSHGLKGYTGTPGKPGHCDDQYCYQTVIGLMQSNGYASSALEYRQGELNSKGPRYR